MSYVEVGDGTKIYYEDFGAGRPLMFVHGGGATHALWQQQVFHLAPELRTIAVDLRGVGMSDKPRDGYGLDRFADDLADIAQALELGELTVVGHGVGNHIILRAAHRHPGFARQLVLCAAAPWYAGDRDDTDGSEGGFSAEFARELSAGVGNDYAQMQWELIQHWLFAEPPTQAAAFANLQMALAWPPYVWKMLERDLVALDHRPYLSDITRPVLIMHGVHDRKNRYTGAAVLADHLPDATVVSFEQSAHCPMVEEVEVFNATLREFATRT